jgi:hypothetical protein
LLLSYSLPSFSPTSAYRLSVLSHRSICLRRRRRRETGESATRQPKDLFLDKICRALDAVVVKILKEHQTTGIYTQEAIQQGMMHIALPIQLPRVLNL